MPQRVDPLPKTIRSSLPRASVPANESARRRHSAGRSVPQRQRGQSPATAPYFIDRHNALVVPQEDPVSLAAAIRWAATHPVEMAEIARHGERLYKEEFSQRVINQKLTEIVSMALQR